MNDAIEYMLNLRVGLHQADVCRRFNCSRNTLVKYINKYVKWVYPPFDHANDNEDVWRKRVHYAHWAATASWRLTNRIRKATFVDHKMMNYFGRNRTHFMQAKRIGEGKGGLKSLRYLMKTQNTLLKTKWKHSTNCGKSCIQHRTRMMMNRSSKNKPSNKS